MYIKDRAHCWLRRAFNFLNNVAKETYSDRWLTTAGQYALIIRRVARAHSTHWHSAFASHFCFGEIIISGHLCSEMYSYYSIHISIGAGTHQQSEIQFSHTLQLGVQAFCSPQPTAFSIFIMDLTAPHKESTTDLIPPVHSLFYLLTNFQRQATSIYNNAKRDKKSISTLWHWKMLNVGWHNLEVLPWFRYSNSAQITMYISVLETIHPKRKGTPLSSTSTRNKRTYAKLCRNWWRELSSISKKWSAFKKARITYTATIGVVLSM